jgi:hypothetical protein
MRKIFVLLFLASTLVTACLPPPQTPSPTPEANKHLVESGIINLLNDYLIHADPVDYALETKFHVVDIQFQAAKDKENAIFYIKMDCQGLCSAKRTFSVLMAAMKIKKNDMKSYWPKGVKEFRLEITDHMNSKGFCTGAWAEIDGYLGGDLTGEQLASRVTCLP